MAIKKQCPICEQFKSLDNFYNQKTTRDGKGSYCKQCCAVYAKIKHNSNPSYRKTQNKKWRDKTHCGVYRIVNRFNNKVYIGASNSYELRKAAHISKLNGGYHVNHELQDDWDVFGPGAFSFDLIKECKKEELPNNEVAMMIKYESLNPDFGYNCHRPNIQ